MATQIGDTYNQPSAAPTGKVGAGGIGGALSIVLMYFIQSVFNVTIPAEVASSITFLIFFAVAYYTREKIS